MNLKGQSPYFNQGFQIQPIPHQYRTLFKGSRIFRFILSLYVKLNDAGKTNFSDFPSWDYIIFSQCQRSCCISGKHKRKLRFLADMAVAARNYNMVTYINEYLKYVPRKEFGSANCVPRDT